MVSVTFEELRLEPSDGCARDSVTLFDHTGIRTFCTDADPSTYTSAGPSLSVYFETDGSTNEGRFALSWTFVSGGGLGWFTTNTSCIFGNIIFDLRQVGWWRGVTATRCVESTTLLHAGPG